MAQLKRGRRSRYGYLLSKITGVHDRNNLPSGTQHQGCPLNCWLGLNFQLISNPFSCRASWTTAVLLAFLKFPLFEHCLFPIIISTCLAALPFLMEVLPLWECKSQTVWFAWVFLKPRAMIGMQQMISGHLLNKWVPRSHGFGWQNSAPYPGRSDCNIHGFLTIYRLCVLKGQTKHKQINKQGHKNRTNQMLSFKEILIYSLTASDLPDSSWKG